MDFGSRSIGREIGLFAPPTYIIRLARGITWEDWRWQLKIYVGLYKPLAQVLMDEAE